MKWKIAVASFATNAVCSVFPAAADATLGPQDFILSPTPSLPEPGLWKPTDADATKAKAALFNYLALDRHPVRGAALASAEQARPTVKARIDHYTLQYVGTHMVWDGGGGGKPDAAGEMEIVIHGLCQTDSEQRAMLLKREVQVLDGGECFFRAYYSLSKNQILWFTINGT